MTTTDIPQLVNPGAVLNDRESNTTEQLLTLALDLALELAPVDVLLQQHNLSKQQLHQIITGNSYFQEVYKELRVHARKAPEQQMVQKHAELFTMELMPHMARLAKSLDTPANVAAQLFKTFSGIATAGTDKAGASGTQFVFNYAPDPRLTRVPAPRVINHDE